MKKRAMMVIVFIFSIVSLSSCNQLIGPNHIQHVGMLIEGDIEHNAWEKKGIEGLEQIKKKYHVDVFYKERITSEQEIINAVDEFVQDGVNLIFGHSSIYGKVFAQIAKSYPDVHFVYFNGGYSDDNLTSLNFNAHAMGFFAGMLASKMTKTNQVGAIAAYEWQPELEGFFEGVKYANPNVKVQMDFLNEWNDNDVAHSMYEKMKEKNVDVFYPAGDSFSEKIIKSANKDHLYAIGYVTDQSSIAPDAVITSTIQHVDLLYDLAASQFNKAELEGGVYTFDFNDNYISLGEFSPEVPEKYKQTVEKAVKEYKKTGLLPNQE